jgi:hypothetical protein
MSPILLNVVPQGVSEIIVCPYFSCPNYYRMKALMADTRSISQQIPRRVPETRRSMLIVAPIYRRMPATVAAQSNTADVGSNPSRVMDVDLRLFYVFVFRV